MSKILIIEDDPYVLKFYARLFALGKYEVEMAGSGKEGLEKARASKPSLILLDIMMPEMDGYEAMHQIRHTLKLHQLPIIALTAKAMAGDREKCIAAGASDYITKPVDIQKLLTLIKTWLSK